MKPHLEQKSVRLCNRRSIRTKIDPYLLHPYSIVCLNRIGPLHIQIKTFCSALSETVLGPKCLEFGTVPVRIGVWQGCVPDETRIYGAHPYHYAGGAGRSLVENSLLSRPTFPSGQGLRTLYEWALFFIKIHAMLYIHSF